MQIDPNIKLDDVIGLDDAKKVLKERLVEYFKYKDVLKYPPSKGILLYGYPGTGKTMLVNATINTLSNPNINFHIVESSEITGYVGTTEKKVQQFFKRINKQAQGRDIVLLMDEVDQLIPKKSTAMGAIVAERVSALLRELDGLESKNDNIFVIATTNHPGKIEDAFLRSGRIDEHIYVKLPNEDERILLVDKYIGYISGCEDIIPIANYTQNWTGADYKRLGSKLEMEQLRQRKPLDNVTISKIVSELNRQRKRNFKTFESEYKKYMNNKP